MRARESMFLLTLAAPVWWLMAGCMSGGQRQIEPAPVRPADVASATEGSGAESNRPYPSEPVAPAIDDRSEAVYEKETTADFASSPVTGDLAKPEAEVASGKKRALETEKPSAPKAEIARGRPPQSGGVKAGAADDNLQFSAFLDFLAENNKLGLPCDVSHRLMVKVQDQDGLPLAGAQVELFDGKKSLLARRVTYADGRAMLFPSEYPGLDSSGLLVVKGAGASYQTSLGQLGRHSLEVRLSAKRPEYQAVPLDIAFVLDTTGSMGDEIQQLKVTLENIHFQVTHLTPRPDVRFGMVLFRDRGDEYVTQVVDFLADVEAFAKKLAPVQAGGGGDTPEDVQEALHQAMKALSWRGQGVRLAFLIGDAPPHLDYGQQYTYVNAMREAAERGIKIATIGASGLDRQGELVWRQVAQYTMAPFVFLTYGEKGDSEGSPSSVSHHVGSNWVAENLDAIVVRLVKVELSHYLPGGAPPQEDYFVADAREGKSVDDVLQDLFGQAIKQLIDYCVQRLEPNTPTVIVPLSVEGTLKAAGRMLQDRLSLGLVRSGRFQLVEREDLPKVLATMSEQFAAHFDERKVAELGKMLPAKLAVFSHLTRQGTGRAEMLVKLVRLETGEILSLSLLKIDPQLLEGG